MNEVLYPAAIWILLMLGILWILITAGIIYYSPNRGERKERGQ